MNHDSLFRTLFYRARAVLRRCYAASGLSSVLSAIAAFFGRIWGGSLLRRILSAESRAARRPVDHASGGVVSGFAARMSAFAEAPPTRRPWADSVLLRGLTSVLDGLPHTSCRSFGFMLMAFAAVSLPFNTSGLRAYLLVAAALCGAVMAIINRSLNNLFGASRIAALAAGFFGWTCDAGVKPVVRFHAFYTAFGAVLAGLFCLLDLNTLVLLGGAVVGGTLVLYRTEIGVFATAFLLPIVPTKLILGLCAITVLSYALKILIVRGGALPFKPGLLELLAAAFGLALCYGVVVSYRPEGSAMVALTYILYILFFVAAKNTLRTRRMVFAVMATLLLSGLIVAGFGCYQQLTGRFVETAAWIDSELFEQATSRIYSTLENPNVLGEYLIFTVIFSFAALYYYKKPVYKLAALGILGVSGMCMLFTQSRGAWLGLLCAVAAFALMRDRRLIPFGIALLCLMPLLLPDAVIARFMSIGSMTDSSTSYRVNIWLACLIMLKTIWFTGIGPGEPSFRYVYQEYAFNAVEAPHSHNLYLQVAIDLSVFGLIILLALFFAFFKKSFATIRHNGGDPFVRTVPAALSAAMFGYLVQGMTDNVWYNYRVTAYFWLMIALCGAMYGLRKREDGEARDGCKA